jgi:hypothetical protein
MALDSGQDRGRGRGEAGLATRKCPRHVSCWDASPITSSEQKLGFRRLPSARNGGASCIEVGLATRIIAVRDTKQHGRGPVLRFTPAAWRRFAEQVKGTRKLGTDRFAARPADIKSRGHSRVRERPLPFVPRCQSANAASIVSLRAARAAAAECHSWTAGVPARVGRAVPDTPHLTPACRAPGVTRQRLHAPRRTGLPCTLLT